MFRTLVLAGVVVQYRRGDPQSWVSIGTAPNSRSVSNRPQLITPKPPSLAPTVLQREGLGGFYKGLVPNVLRVMPQSALTFLVYESVMRVLADRQAQQAQQQAQRVTQKVG